MSMFFTNLCLDMSAGMKLFEILRFLAFTDSEETLVCADRELGELIEVHRHEREVPIG